jgi:very-short-patch-repair endonuclease
MRTKEPPVTLICETCEERFERRAAYHRHLVEKRGITRVFCSRPCKEASERRSNYGDLRERYEAGATIAGLATIHKVCPEAIRKRLLKLGAKIRNSGAHLSGDHNPTRGKGHAPEAIAKIRAANRRQFNDPAARERHALLTCKQITEGRTGKAYNKLESRVTAKFDAEGVRYVQQHRVGRFVFDFYLPDSNTLVESHGTFWHADPRSYDHSSLYPIQKRNVENDQRKADRAAKDGYSVRVIWEADVD